MDIIVIVMIYSFVNVTFSSCHGGSHFYESLMVGVRFHSLLSILHELSQQIYNRKSMSLFTPLSSLFSHASPSAGPWEVFPYIWYQIDSLGSLTMTIKFSLRPFTMRTANIFIVSDLHVIKVHV